MKTRNINTQLIIGMSMSLFAACGPEFLEVKPNTNIVAPQSIQDYQDMLDFFRVNNTAGLPQLSADEYVIENEADWLALTVVQRNAYSWAKDIYEGEREIGDWNTPFESVFYANSVISGLENMDLALKETSEYQNVLGHAYFTRAFSNFDLAKNFAPPFDSATADVALGIPLRYTPNINEIAKRATLQETYDHIVNDLNKAIRLLPPNIPLLRNRPSKPAAYALAARMFLSMRNYEMAELYADSCLALYANLIDYNTVSPVAATPFPIDHEESIFFARQVMSYPVTQYASTAKITVNPQLYALYEEGDLRRQVFFIVDPVNGSIKVKRGYAGTIWYPFSGLATDEVYLIKAECAARRGAASEALDYLNDLLSKRYQDGTFEPYKMANATKVLEVVLSERRKELVWRAGIRWDDLRRLNMEGAAISLTRTIGSNTYTLEPNSPRYTFPIPDDEIVMSGIQQNVR